MAELKQLEFYLLRYVPNAVRGEFVNIGLIMVEAEAGGFADVRFASDWRGVERLNPQADIEMLQALERSIRREFEHPEKRGTLLRKMQDSISNLIQLSPMIPCIAEDPANEIEALASFYFKSVHQPSERVPRGRNWIWQQMRTAFEHEGILGSLLRDIPMEKYTQPGDPLKLDFGYAVDKELKLFQAVSLTGSLAPANYFGSRAPGILKDLAEKTETFPLLTVVVDEDWDRDNSEIKYALGTMRRNLVEVAVLTDMPKIAGRARLELRF